MRAERKSHSGSPHSSRHPPPMSADVAPGRATRLEGDVLMSTVVKNPVVKTRSGEVRGSVANGVNTFKGIPYAAPPFGANRLRPPQPVVPWGGVRDALTFSPLPPQPPLPRKSAHSSRWVPSLARTA